MASATDTFSPSDGPIVRAQAIKGQCKVSHILETGLALVFQSFLSNVKFDIDIVRPLDISCEFKIAIELFYTVEGLHIFMLSNAYIFKTLSIQML